MIGTAFCSVKAPHPRPYRHGRAIEGSKGSAKAYRIGSQFLYRMELQFISLSCQYS